MRRDRQCRRLYAYVDRLLDALAAADLPVIEVHLSNIFRRGGIPPSLLCLADRARRGCGFGGFGYELALEAAAQLWTSPRELNSPDTRHDADEEAFRHRSSTSGRQLANVLAGSGLSEIEYAAATCRIRVGKTHAAHGGRPGAASRPQRLDARIDDSRREGRTGATEAETFADHPGLLTSPMVGVVYTSPEPAAPPFVQSAIRWPWATRCC